MKRRLLIAIAVAAIFALALPLAGCAKSSETLALPESESEDTTELTRASGAFVDKTIICKDCGGEFIFTAAEQEFYAEKGFQNVPSRCKACRQSRRDDQHPPRESFTVICANCGMETQVPFEPRNDRPVYCSACFQARRES